MDQDAFVTFAFNGTAVSWIGFRGPQAGIARVLLDGVLADTIDTYAPAEEIEAVLFTRTGLAPGVHTLRIEVTGDKNPSSSGWLIVIDGFDAGGVRVQDAATGALAYVDHWVQGDNSRPFSGGTAAYIQYALSHVTLSFAGTAVSWIGFRGPQMGIAEVFLDDVLVATVDGYAPAEEMQAVLFTQSGLTAGHHTLRVRATGLQNPAATGALVVVDAFDVTRSPARRFENTDPAIVYTPGSSVGPTTWFHGSRSRNWSGDTASFNRSEGARASLTFSGTAVSWIGFRASWAGVARVYIDGVFMKQIDLYIGAGRDPAAPPCPQPKPADCFDEETQVAVFTAMGLAPGSHTIVVESTTLRNPLALDNAVVVDAFDVAPSSSPTTEGARVEETSATYTGTWTQGDSSRTWSGGTAAVSTTAGARATFDFSGTEVRWVGLRGPQTGTARIFLDGAFHAEINTSSALDVQTVAFMANGLAPARHTLTIEVVDGLIAVDAIDLRSRFENRDLSVTFTPEWVPDHDQAWSGTALSTGIGTAGRSVTAGARAEFAFTGSAVSWLGFRGPYTGIARVYLDGTLAETIDTYAATEQVGAVLFTRSGLTDTPHTLAIEVTGDRNPAASNNVIYVDAFDVTLPPVLPTVSRVQQTDPAVTYTPGNWGSSNPTPLFSGQTASFSATAGARANFAFTGTGVRWISSRLWDVGIARVYLDGVPVGEVDTFNQLQLEYQATVFSLTSLAPGPHTLTIEVTGLKHPDSQGYTVVIDAFEIVQ
jgi:hypothetical protein